MLKLVICFLLVALYAAAFTISPSGQLLSSTRCQQPWAGRVRFLSTTSLFADTKDDGDDDDDADAEAPRPPLPSIEKAWRHAKKVLLRIGGKGVTATHGNSLRQLLEDHTVVKVKVNTQKYGTLIDMFHILKKLAEDAGAPEGVEYIQSRDIEKTIMFGMPGTLERIQSGDFPPPPPPAWKSSAELKAEADLVDEGI